MAEDQQNVNEVDVSASPPLTKRQKIIFCGIAASYVFNLMSFSIIAPFFPAEAAKKGLSPTQVGFIFALFNLVNFLASPLFGKFLPVLGAKFVFLSGAWVAAGCNVLFGVLDEIEDTQTFMIFCFVVRAIEACGSAASITASMTITANAFPDNMAQMMGILESFSGIAFMVGPPLGGLFYSIGGYKLPFFALGGISVATIIFNIILLPSVGVGRAESGSLKNMFLIPAFYPTALAVIIGSASLGFLDPTLSPHLLSFDLSAPLVAVSFLLMGGVYALTSPLWGYLADKKKNTRFMMVIGFYLSAISYLLLGPSPLLNLPKQLWIVLFALSLAGLSIGSLMPAFLDMFISAGWYGFRDDLSTQEFVWSLQTVSFL
ncbi:putative MFS-type transporter SLC18B1 [Apostichopus japonicus]|uniref:Putative MFS-type transporter SLC18B1 n=1 Tax=Stichopus japonicus TaxID=307972 RepID=A0A2G8LA17_STIJA|nr:putative MFS-type transporter SLC18B1 [Apostichopus japonicus]